MLLFVVRLAVPEADLIVEADDLALVAEARVDTTVEAEAEVIRIVVPDEA